MFPAKVNGIETGFEFSLGPKDDVLSAYPELTGRTKAHDSVATFTTGGDLQEFAASAIAAATLVSLGEGLLFDPQEDDQFPASQAIEYAKQVVQSV
jgi:hypothetical protein